MRKYVRFFYVITFISLFAYNLTAQDTITYHCDIYTTKQAKKSSAGLLKKYCASLVPGVLIGATSGFMCYTAEKYIICPPISWIVAYIIRDAVIDSVSHDFDEYDIKHNKYLMCMTAWVMDWLTYLRQYSSVPSSNPQNISIFNLRL